MTLTQIIEMMEHAVEARRQSLGPQTGMHVPYHGELASAPPSVLRDVEWWIGRLKETTEASRSLALDTVLRALVSPPSDDALRRDLQHYARLLTSDTSGDWSFEAAARGEAWCLKQGAKRD